MDAEANERSRESTSRETSEPTQETPESKLRDLRPEKDPMGAGTDSLAKTGKKKPF